MALRQLPLPFPHAPEFSAADFLEAPSNAAARTWLARPEAWPGGRLALWGGAGVGKSHLLHLWARLWAVPVLDGSALRGMPLAGPAAVVDDADMAAEQTALLFLLNAAEQASARVLLAGRTPPARWSVGLADLASRLAAIQVVEVAAPEEALLAMLFARLLAERQLVLSAGLQAWVLARLPRHPAALIEAVARLDRAALAAGRAVSRGLAEKVLAGLIGADDRLVSPSPPTPSLL